MIEVIFNNKEDFEKICDEEYVAGKPTPMTKKQAEEVVRLKLAIYANDSSNLLHSKPMKLQTTDINQFKKFHKLLTDGAIVCGFSDYIPFYFPVSAKEKDPDSLELYNMAPELSQCCNAPWAKISGKNKCSACKITSRGSWKNESSRLSFEAACKRLEAGGNVGIAAREADPLVIMDGDSSKAVLELPKDTLRCISRTRLGVHAFCFTSDKRLKINKPTDSDGELRACDQYVVAAGSFVPTTKKGLDKKVTEGSISTEEAEKILLDPLLGLYSVENDVPPKLMTFEELPKIYTTTVSTTTTTITEKTPEPVKETCTPSVAEVHPLHKLTFSDILGGWDGQRMPHPLHDSETGQNFSIEQPHLAQCWRHNVSLTPVQFLAVKAGYCSCEQAGNGHKNSGAGKSQVTQNLVAYEAAFNQAVKDGFLPKDCPSPLQSQFKTEGQNAPVGPNAYVIPIRTMEIDGTSAKTLTQYLVNDICITHQSVKTVTTKKVTKNILNCEQIIAGNLKIVARIIFRKTDEREINWHIQYEGDDIVGNFDQITDTIYSYGKTTAEKAKLKILVSHMINHAKVPSRLVYPAVGIYWNQEQELPIVVGTQQEVNPNTDAQAVYLKTFELAMSKSEQHDIKEVLQASVDFINSMPAINKESALIARGFGCIAPLAFVIKETAINVFPYLYLYGQKGSSKTQMATMAASYMFGEREPLSGDAVESAFRLGMEFTSTTYPRVIDEAHDVFIKNLSIFKAAATSITATKRGNKDKTMDSYQAYCSFIFTSNAIPISPEEDAQGSVMDRLLVVDCGSGEDFDKKLYQHSTKILTSKSPRIGIELIQYLTKKLTEDKINWFVNRIIDLSDKFKGIDEQITLRRAYCLAELVIGIQIYLELLTKNGVTLPFPNLSEDDLCMLIYDKIHQPTRYDEYSNILTFMEWVNGQIQQKPDEYIRNGLYVPSPAQHTAFHNGHDSVLITTVALQKYKQTMGFANKPYSTLPEIERDLKKLDVVAKVAHDRLNTGSSCSRTLRIDLIDYEEKVQKKLTESKEKLDATKIKR